MHDCLVDFVWLGAGPWLGGGISFLRLAGLAGLGLAGLGFQNLFPRADFGIQNWSGFLVSGLRFRV